MRLIRNRLNALLTTDQFTYTQLRGMFLTLMLDQFFIFFINTLSTAMVSSIGEAAIAAVSMVGTLNGMVSLMFTSLATGGAILVARTKGANDIEGIRCAVGEVTGLCCVVALTLGSALYALSDVLVRALYADVEPILIEYAVSYMRMMCLSFVPYSVFNALFNVLRNLGDTRSSLMLTVFINALHLVLSLLFINIMGLGVTGSGLSYVVARTAGMTLAILWILVFHNQYGVKIRHFFRFSLRVTRQIASLGMPVAVESMLIQGGMLLVQVYLARLTTTELAAYAVSNSIHMLTYTTSGALTALASTVCGQCYGAKRYDLTRQYCMNLIRVGRYALLLTSAALMAAMPALMALYHATEAGRPLIFTSLAIGLAGMPLLWGDSYIPAMTLRVAGDGVYTGAVSVISLLVARCALGYLLAIHMGIGVAGVWIALQAEMLIRAVALHLRMRGDRWMHISARQESRA